MTLFPNNLDPSSAKAAASLHQRAFKNFFLTTLGVRFLESFYKAIISRNDTFCRGYWDDKKRLCGFLVANQKHEGFYKDLCKKNLFSFVVSSFEKFVLNPLLILRLAKSFRSNSESHGLEGHPYLMSICVDPALQGKGVGKLMINDLVKILQDGGYKGLYLTTDADSNDSANSFYASTGFQLKASYYQGKRKMNVYFRHF